MLLPLLEFQNSIRESLYYIRFENRILDNITFMIIYLERRTSPTDTSTKRGVNERRLLTRGEGIGVPCRPRRHYGTLGQETGYSGKSLK